MNSTKLIVLLLDIKQIYFYNQLITNTFVEKEKIDRA